MLEGGAFAVCGRTVVQRNAKISAVAFGTKNEPRKVNRTVSGMRVCLESYSSSALPIFIITFKMHKKCGWSATDKTGSG